MASNFATTEYTQTYNSFSGADIKASFGNLVIGELASITYSVTREKAPIFTMGNPNPRSFSRGKRGIAGSLVFTVFDRDALYNIKEGSTVYRQSFNDSSYRQKDASGNIIGGARPSAVQNDSQTTMGDNRSNWAKGERPNYSDEIPPFDISISFMNEYGSASEMSIYGVEILNEGMGMSIDDITTEKSCTFVARGISDMRSDEYVKKDKTQTY